MGTVEKRDNYYGINQISKNVNIGNRKKLINGNGFVFGVPGSDKSFFCKMEMGSVFLSGDDEIIVIDPMNEYFDIAETYGGTVVNMSTYTDNYVNPLEMDVWSLDPNDSKGMVREKGEFMLGLCEQCIGDSLNSRQKSIIANEKFHYIEPQHKKYFLDTMWKIGIAIKESRLIEITY